MPYKCCLVVSWHQNCCIPGSFQAPWCSLGEGGEQYCLVWESRFLRDLGSAMASLLDGLVSIVAQEALKYTVLSGRWTVMRQVLALFSAARSGNKRVCACGKLFSVLTFKRGMRDMQKKKKKQCYCCTCNEWISVKQSWQSYLATDLLLYWHLLSTTLMPFTPSHCPGIVAALTWPASLLAAASVIDNPWCVCLNRSAEVGKHLAQVLRSRQQVLYHSVPQYYVSCLSTRASRIFCVHKLLTALVQLQP